MAIVLNVVIPIFAFVVSVIGAYFTYTQNMISRDYAVRQLRAYIGVGDIFVGEKFPTYVKVPMTNAGQTPAYRVRAHLSRIRLGLGQRLPDNYQYADLGINNTGSITTLGPGVSKSFEFPIDSNELGMVRNNQIALFIYGHVDYYDIYDVFHTSQFMYEYKGENIQPSGVEHIFVLQDKYNEAT